LSICGFAAKEISLLHYMLTLKTVNAMEQTVTAGQIIDMAISADQARSDKKLTEYVRDVVAPIAELSARQISRMREYDGFPESRAMTNLIKALPNLAFLDSASMFSRVLLPWDNIELDQSSLVRPSVITIFAGWKPPAGISSSNIARSIAINIDAGDKYAFVYPHPSTYQGGENESQAQVNQWLNNLKSKVSGSWHQKIAEDNDGTSSPDTLFEQVRGFTTKVDQAIKCIYTSPETDLWLLLPSPYCIFYNLGLQTKGASSRHGAFLVSGVLASEYKEVVNSQGWLLTNREQYDQLERSFLKDVQTWPSYINDLC
jgi:hypothetical protein